MAHDDATTVMAELHYRDPRAALDWLAAAFGCETQMMVFDQTGRLVFSNAGWGEQVFAVLPESPPSRVSPKTADGFNTQVLQVSLAGDIIAHCQAARAAGAKILREPDSQFYGRTYAAADLEGHVWTFRQRAETTSGPPEGWRVEFPNPPGARS